MDDDVQMTTVEEVSQGTSSAQANDAVPPPTPAQANDTVPSPTPASHSDENFFASFACIHPPTPNADTNPIGISDHNSVADSVDAELAAAAAKAAAAAADLEELWKKPWEEHGYPNPSYELIGHWVQFDSKQKIVIKEGNKLIEEPITMIGLVIGCQVNRAKNQTVHRLYVEAVKKVQEFVLQERDWERLGYMRPYHNHELVGKRIAVLWSAEYNDLEMRALAAQRYNGQARAYYEAYVVDVKHRASDKYVIAYPVDDESQVQTTSLTPGDSNWTILERGVNSVDGLAVISWFGEVENQE